MSSSRYRVGLTLIAVVASVVYLSRPAFAADLCKVLVLRDVAALENPGSIMKKGEYQTAITQYIYNKATREFNFCSHGGHCYPAHVLVDGRPLETLKLVNCKIGAIGYEDKEEISYDILVDRSKNSAASLRRDNVDYQFRVLGLCNACASNAASAYVDSPNTICGKLAKQALEEIPVAMDKLSVCF